MTGVETRMARLYRARHTVRVRLAMLYAGVFFASGLVLLAIPAAFVRIGSSSRAVSSGLRDASPPSVGIARSQHSIDVHNLVVGSLLALALLVLVSAVLGWAVAGRLLRPLRTITETAREISASNLHRRLALDGPDDEFHELGQTLDDLFARLEGSFDAQRRFVANASHELLTPVTAERTVLQVALADPHADSQALRAACQQVLVLGEQQQRLVDALLTLATSERGIERRQRCDLAAITASALQAHRSDIERRRLHTEVMLRSAWVDGDPHLLRSLVTNLVENAIRHNFDGGRLRIGTATTAPGPATLVVGNAGPVIAPAELDRLFLPFQRLGADRVRRIDGHGIGLSVVQAIATAHGATITTNARPEGGLDVEVSFPLCRPVL
jgi:signal transduction histidine kinase